MWIPEISILLPRKVIGNSKMEIENAKHGAKLLTDLTERICFCSFLSCSGHTPWRSPTLAQYSTSLGPVMALSLQGLVGMVRLSLLM